MTEPGLEPQPESVESRLEALEKALAALTVELTALRAMQVVSRPERRKSAPRLADTSGNGRATRLPRQDFEGLIGRYGMLGIAVLAAIAAVGTFLSWAVSHGYLTLGPTARVFLGLGLAAAIAVWGFALRRTERSFGSSMLGLALVIAQLCAYAAGPSFHLVPTAVAFLIAAISSWGLAIFAHAENDEPLWCVGFGGATVAPFVTTGGHADVYVVALYAVVVLLPGCFAISHRDWPIGWRVFYLAAALFTLTAAYEAHTRGLYGYVAAFTLPFAVAAAGVIPFAPATRKRGALRWLAVMAFLASLAAHGGRSTTIVFAAVMAAASCIWLGIVDRNADVAQSSISIQARALPGFLDWFDVAALPLLFALQAVNLAGHPQDSAAIYGVTVAALIVFAWRRAVGPLRDGAAFAATVAAVALVDILALELPTGRVAAFLVIALAALAMHRVRPSRSWLAMGVLLLVVAASFSGKALVTRPLYRVPPFTSEPSLDALLVTIALVLVGRFWYWVRIATRASIAGRPEWTYAGSLRVIVRAVTVAPWVWAFIWVTIELAMAYSASTATLLLVTYFAAVAVSCVGAGRARHSSKLRKTGLALAVAAAGTACFGATTHFDISFRIAAYLVTSVFLLGIAYWYRRPGSSEL